MGQYGYRSLHRLIGSWRGLVRTPSLDILQFATAHWVLYLLTVGCLQGYFHHRLFDSRCSRQGPSNPNQEPDLDYFLRSRRNLWRHHGHCLFLQDRER